LSVAVALAAQALQMIARAWTALLILAIKSHVHDVHVVHVYSVNTIKYSDGQSEC